MRIVFIKKHQKRLILELVTSPKAYFTFHHPTIRSPIRIHSQENDDRQNPSYFIHVKIGKLKH